MNDEQAFAALDYGSWLRYTKNDWVLAAGSGVRDQYNGNKDAGQLWIDLHTKSPIQNEYYPYITNARLEMQWLGIGRKFRKTVKKTSAEVEIFARYIRANEFITRSAYGSVKGEDFEGLVKIVSSEDPGYEPTPGKGWSLDAHVQATINKDWWCGISVQGLAGKLSWQNLAVEDGYVMSQRVFEDPDGFLHDTGNISGLDYRQDVSLDLLSSGRADVVYSRRIPNVLLGITWVESYSTVPSIGLAWPQKKHWIPFVRWHARDNELQLGCIGSSFQLDVSMNEWPLRSSTNAGLMLQIGPLTF
ncbi:MAG: hypothetical protein ABFD54_09785 [Armatimonadota bacterium]|nr:hypothetical protein [bacterium]